MKESLALPAPPSGIIRQRVGWGHKCQHVDALVDWADVVRPHLTWLQVLEAWNQANPECRYASRQALINSYRWGTLVRRG